MRLVGAISAEMVEVIKSLYSIYKSAMHSYDFALDKASIVEYVLLTIETRDAIHKNLAKRADTYKTHELITGTASEPSGLRSAFSSAKTFINASDRSDNPQSRFLCSEPSMPRYIQEAIETRRVKTIRLAEADTQAKAEQLFASGEKTLPVSEETLETIAIEYANVTEASLGPRIARCTTEGGSRAENDD